ncbi:MAG TPA: nucleotidyl transferase AbiEii/AbiGii toxin family protein [Longimicrobium sp.]|nr:nucleotidyl transferase AbiEii/AbiGii toxin family protein [Longimicrobium sp.]
MIEIVREAATAQEIENLRLDGGTTLAAFYLHHRESEDLDFFCDPPFNAVAFGEAVQEHARAAGIEITSMGRANLSISRLLARNHDRPGQQVKIDLVLQSPFRLEPLDDTENGIQIPSYRDICAGKLHAVCDRFAERDFIDLHVILTQPHGGSPASDDVICQRFEALMRDLKECDPGLDPPYVGQAIMQGLGRPIVSAFPLRLLIPIDEAALQHTLDLCVNDCARRTQHAAPSE